MAVNKIRLRSLADEGNKRAAMVLDITENHTRKMLQCHTDRQQYREHLCLFACYFTCLSFWRLYGQYRNRCMADCCDPRIRRERLPRRGVCNVNAEKVTLRYIPFFKFFMTVMTPFIFIINLFSRVIMLIMHVDPDAVNNAMTEEELRTIVDVSHEDGVIESDEKEMIYNVFDAGDANAKDIMVPKVHVTFASVDNTYEELIDIFP